MDVQVTVTLSDEEKTELTQILNCTEAELPTVLKAFSSASLQEYISMILGQKVFKRGTDILEYRLFLLIEGVFDNKVPDEQEVCKLFQTTSTESRSLIRSVISKYQYQLKAAVEKTIKSILENAQQENDQMPYTININSQNVVEELNRQLASIDGNLTAVTKKRGCVSIYEIKQSSYARLCEKFNIVEEDDNDE
jgi:hypothetical protein